MEPDAGSRRPDTRPRPGRGRRTLPGRRSTASADLGDSRLPLALSQPRDALEAALRILAESTDPRDLSIAHQTAAIVLRDRGETGEASAHGFAALRQAR